MSKKLVAYFSASGITRNVAKMVAEAAGADLYEITPKEAYTKADLNWMDKKSRSSVEMADKKIRPEITDTDAKIAEYDEIFLGFPIWWYVAPTIINTFLEKYDFTGKKIVLFATSGGSGFGNTVKELQPSAPGAQFVEGKLLLNLHPYHLKSVQPVSGCLSWYQKLLLPVFFILPSGIYTCKLNHFTPFIFT